MATWMDSAFFGIHYDLHARPADTTLGAELTPEHLRERLRLVRPDWIHCDGKGHPGYTSWPTKVGSAAPGIVRDAMRIHRDVTRELGVRLGVHYSGVWDIRAIELHPDWACRDADGKPHPRATCRNSAYLDELMIPQLVELVEIYDIDGLWVDGDNWGSVACWCERCRAEFSRRTGLAPAPRGPGENHWPQWLAFHRSLFEEYVDRWTKAVHRARQDCALTSSFMYGARQPEPAMQARLDYLSGDIDFRWGAEHALLEARVYDARRSCAARPLPWNLMAWMHTHPGEMGDPRPWLLKPVVHLCQEVSEVLALGGAVMVYENPQRSGRLIGWHHEAIAKIAGFCRARQKFCFQTVSVPQAAILHSAESFYAHTTPLYQYEPGTDPVEGALHALTELHRSTDVLTEDAAAARMKDYPLLVVPEQDRLSAQWIKLLGEYAAGGGHLLLTGAHLSRLCPDLVGATPRGEPIEKAVFLPVGKQAAGLAGAWQPVQPQPGTEVLACRLTHQEPSADRTDQALITRRNARGGWIVAVHGPLFADYFNWPLPLLRELIGNLVDDFPIDWLAEADGPPRLEMVLRRKNGRLLVNLINRGPAVSVLPPKRILIEELPPIHDIVLRVRRKTKPRAVKLAPGKQPIEWSHRRGLLTVKVPRVDVHEVVVIE
jgi:hypothetical protein